jgi:hypothetical protein
MADDFYSKHIPDGSGSPPPKKKTPEISAEKLHNILEGNYLNISFICWMHSFVIMFCVVDIIYIYSGFKREAMFESTIYLVLIFFFFFLGLLLRKKKLIALWIYVIFFGGFASIIGIASFDIKIQEYLINNFIIIHILGSLYFILLFFIYVFIFILGIRMLWGHYKFRRMTANPNDFRFEEDGWEEEE